MVDSYLIPHPMAQSTLIKRGWAQGCSSAHIRRKHICLPYDGEWCHPCHHCIVQERSTSTSHLDIPQGAHHVGTSAYTMDHPGLPPDLGNWDHWIGCCVCVGCTQQS